jgi:hypothetical protein
MATSILTAKNARKNRDQYQQGLQAALDALRQIEKITCELDSDVTEEQWQNACDKRNHDSEMALVKALGLDLPAHQAGFISAICDFVQYAFWVAEPPDMETWKPGELK